MSSAADPTAAFLDALRASRLLGPAQVQILSDWVAQARPDPPALAKEVYARGWLTPYQIREVFRGRGKDLVLGQFVLLDLLGEGGMGRVYRAHNTRLGRDEAVKVIRKEKLAHPSTGARFDQEMKALGQLKHPNVVTAFDAGPVGDTHFVSMELIDGTDLTRLVRERGPLAAPAACEYIRQAALGLEHAFEMGLVHRDIKPSNILVTRDGRQVKLVDLGLALVGEPPGGEDGSRLTQEGFVIGTPDFLAPEQARDPTTVDIRADIYALGATLFYVLTGKVPYDGASPTEKMLKHCNDPPPALLPLRPDAPPELEQLIHWCMAKRPEDRPQTPLQLAQALEPFCPGRRSDTAGPVQPPVSAAGYAPHPVPAAHPPAPRPLPVPSGQAFQLPARATRDDPIRRRARAGFPSGLLFVGLGTVCLLAVLGFAVYRGFFGDRDPGPVEPLTNSVGMKMVRLDGGTFRMGSPPTEPGRPDPEPGLPDDEGPAHEVTVRGPFLMSATEVTHAQYLKVAGVSPAGSAVVRKAASPAEHPVEAVSYEDAVEFCRKLTEKEKGQPWARRGWEYRLPTEAEWEYACRAGTATPFWNGDSILNRRQALYSPTGEAREVALEGGSTPGPVPSGIPGRVAQFDPNPWGLYDTHGNVAEWCLDWYQRGYPGDGPRDNPTGPEKGDRRVVRGGSFKDPASACRSAARAAFRPTDRRDFIGFRVVYAPK